METLPAEISADIERRAYDFFFPKRRAISLRYPYLAPAAVAAHRAINDVKRSFGTRRLPQETLQLPVLLYKHGSLLRRKLGVSDPSLQERKIHNLRIALRLLDGIVIPPGEVFSFWKMLGSITEKKGYVDGMLLSRGKVIEGIGGGLCQLSNLLYWMFLHAEVDVEERHHHSFDAFPDNGRMLPFGSGATIMDRILDLQVRNISDQRLQLRLWLSDTHLYGALYGMHASKQKYHVSERHPFFVRVNGQVFRYNRLMREVLHEGAVLRMEALATNFAPVLYDVPEEKITEFKPVYRRNEQRRTRTFDAGMLLVARARSIMSAARNSAV